MKKKKWFLAVFRRCLMFVYASVDVENWRKKKNPTFGAATTDKEAEKNVY
jgi:hypothetical protein